jgi:hypothetical protein
LQLGSWLIGHCFGPFVVPLPLDPLLRHRAAVPVC